MSKFYIPRNSLNIVCLIPGHSSLMMLKNTESRSLPDEVTWCFRNTPSFFAPIFKIAFCDCWFKTSVLSSTRLTNKVSKAKLSSRNLHALFRPDPWCLGCIHVQPISTLLLGIEIEPNLVDPAVEFIFTLSKITLSRNSYHF